MNDEVGNGKLEITTLEPDAGMCNLQIDNENPACQTATATAVYAGEKEVGEQKAGI